MNIYKQNYILKKYKINYNKKVHKIFNQKIIKYDLFNIYLFF